MLYSGGITEKSGKTPFLRSYAYPKYSNASPSSLGKVFHKKKGSLNIIKRPEKIKSGYFVINDLIIIYSYLKVLN
jgi:pantothenate kinase